MKNLTVMLVCSLLCIAMHQRLPTPPKTTTKVGDKDLFGIVKKGTANDLIAALLRGGDVNSVDDAGMSLLHHAAQLGKDDMVEVLTRHGVNTEMLNNANSTALQLAQEAQHTKVVELLQGSVKESDDGGGCDNSLHLASLAGDIDEVRKLLAEGAAVNGLDDLGRTALHYAALKGNEELVNLLLENQADLNVQDNFGNTPATAAQFANQPRIVTVLEDWQKSAEQVAEQVEEKEKQDEKIKARREKALAVRAKNKTCPRQWQ